MSKSTTSETACISPICMNLATTLAAVCFRRLASSPTVISSGMEIFSWALRAFSSWMRCRRSASVSRRRPNCWPRRLLRLLNFSFLPVGWFLRLLGMLRLSARSSYRALNLSTFTSTVRVSTDTWARLTFTCSVAATGFLMPVSAASSCSVTRFSLRFSAGFSGLRFSRLASCFLASGFFASALGAGLGSSFLAPLARYASRLASAFSRVSVSSRKFSSFSPKVPPVL